MQRRGLLYHLRSVLAALLGLSGEQARNGDWWEIDLILIMLLGALALGVFAWVQL